MDYFFLLINKVINVEVRAACFSGIKPNFKEWSLNLYIFHFIRIFVFLFLPVIAMHAKEKHQDSIKDAVFRTMYK